RGTAGAARGPGERSRLACARVGHPPRRGDSSRLFPLPDPVGGHDRRCRSVVGHFDGREPVDSVRASHRPRNRRRALLRAPHPQQGRAQEARMTSPEGRGTTGGATPDPLVPRPAATVMLIRDTADGIKVFLMRRHSAMDFVAGVMVFPGGGVDARDRNADIAWFGPETDWWAA